MPLYPCVGLQTVGEEIVANFGQQPFVFDLKSYVGSPREGSVLSFFISSFFFLQCFSFSDADLRAILTVLWDFKGTAALLS